MCLCRVCAEVEARWEENVSASCLCRSGSKMRGEYVCVVSVLKWKQDERRMCQSGKENILK